MLRFSGSVKRRIGPAWVAPSVEVLPRLAVSLLVVGITSLHVGTVWAQDPSPAITPTISLTPDRGSPGQTTVTVSGDDFPESALIQITYDGTPVGTVDTGGGSWTWGFTVPASPEGPHTIQAETATATFSVKPIAYLSADSGPLGTQVEVTGDGFGALQKGIPVVFNEAQVALASADTMGSLLISFDVPPVSGGSYAVVAGTAPPVTFTVTPALSTSRSNGPPGTAVTAIGTGFAANAAVKITFDGAQLLSVAADDQGLVSTSFQVPVAPGGPRIVSASGPSAKTAQTSFTITPSVSLVHLNASAGTSVTVTGAGFAANEAGIFVSLDGIPVASGISADPNGSWTASFIAPSLPAGSYSVQVSGTVTPATSVPAVTLTLGASLRLARSSGSPGTILRITGSGFRAMESIRVTVGDGLTETFASADERGEWTASTIVPPTPAGPVLIRASGTGAPVDASFIVTPRFVISQPTGPPGSLLTIAGDGFGANQIGISITFAAAVVAFASADARGSWTTTFTIPPAPKGTYSIGVSGSTLDLQVPFILTPTVSLNASRANPGASLTVAGLGFARNERDIAVNVDGTPVVSSISADADGSWTASFIAPPLPAGLHVVRASGSLTSAADVPVDGSFIVTPRFSVSRPSGPPGSLLTIAGDGFGANQIGISITLAGAVVASASADGQGSWTAAFTVPPAPKGTYAIGVSGPTLDLRAPFTVTPAVHLDANRAGPGTSLAVTGFGFARDERDITVTLDDTPVALGILATADGSWTASFIVPQLPAGSYSLRAFGPLTLANGARQETLSIGARLAITPPSGTPGAAIRITGSGFEPNERDIVITFDGSPVATVLAADSHGAFSAIFLVPPSASGLHFIRGEGSTPGAIESPEIGFQTIPTITLDRSSGPPRVPITVAGSGFAANETGIAITYDDSPALSGLAADAEGSFAASFVIPPSPAGSHLVQASGSVTALDSRPARAFTVKPDLDLSESEGSVGMDLKVTGRGFAASAPVTLIYDDGLKEATARADPSGSLRMQFTIPRSRHGDHLIKVIDAEGNEAQAKFVIESTPPTAPDLLFPEDGARGGLLGGFRPGPTWAPVDDPSGVTYTLQLDTDPGFSGPLLEKQGLASASYALAEEEALQRGKYYWRVRAIDAAGNEGPWSHPFVVQSGILPLWAIPALGGVGMLLAGGAAYALVLRRRSRWPKAAKVVDLVGEARPEPTLKLSADTTSPALGPGVRLALFAPFRRGRRPSPEEQARAQLTVRFVSSLPLPRLSSDLRWLEELVDSAGNPTDDLYDQILEGEIDVRYEPAWVRHPAYEEQGRLFRGHPVLQGVQEYVEAVDECAADALSLLRRVHRDVDSAVMCAASSGQDRWRFILAVGQDTLAWFRGTYLQEPSIRHYVLEAFSNSAGGQSVSLHGEENTSFRGPLIESLSEEDSMVYRDLHIQLRIKYRSDEGARLLAAKTASADILREHLMIAIARLDGLPPHR